MNRPVHFELGVENPQRALKFYREVFGWKTEIGEQEQQYWLLISENSAEPRVIGGLMTHTGKMPRVVNTIGVESLDETCLKVVAGGGKIVMEKTAIPGIGWQAYCVDTEGIYFGIHQRDPAAN
jgi:predicted enzyme related to lactoylglutathione lyase